MCQPSASFTRSSMLALIACLTVSPSRTRTEENGMGRTASKYKSSVCSGEKYKTKPMLFSVLFPFCTHPAVYGGYDDARVHE